jgi:hypothetical protein
MPDDPRGNPITIIRAGSIRGFASSQNPLALPEGFMSSLKNARLTDGILQARPGGAELSTYLAATAGTAIGWYTAWLDGTQYIFVALNNSGVISVYASSNLGTTFAEITGASGPYGDTRLTGVGENPVYFAVATQYAGLQNQQHDVLVIQSGVDQPRIWGASDGLTVLTPGSGTMRISVNQQPPPVSTVYSSAAYMKAVFGVYANIGSATYVDSTTHFTAQTEPGPGSPGSVWLVEDASAADGQYITATLGSSMNLSGATQLVVGLICKTPPTGGYTTAVPSDYEITLSDGTNTLVVWGGASAVSGSFYVDAGPASANGVTGELYYICVPQSVLSSGSLNLAAITKFTVTLLNSHGVTGGVSQYVSLMTCFAESGTQPNGWNFEAALYAADSRSLGAPAPLPLKYALDGFGVTVTDPRLYIAYQYVFTLPTGLSTYQDFDHVVIYLQLTGQSYYYLADYIAAATYSGGSWHYANLSGGFNNTGVVDYTFPAPQASAVTIPIGTAMLAAQGRLFVAARRNPTDTSATINTEWFSIFGQPFVFYPFQITDPVTETVDPLSGSTRTFNGETISCFCAMGAMGGPSESQGTPVTGIATLFVFTTQNLYMLGGYDAASLTKAMLVSPHGTFCPFSVAIYENRIYWLDSEFQIRRYQWGFTEQLSVEVVDNLLANIPASRLTGVWGACLERAYYLSFTPAGGTVNTYILKWSEIRNAFESLDVPSGYSMESLTAYYDSTANYIRLLGIGADSGIYEHAQPGAAGDLGGSTVALSFVPGWLTAPEPWSLIKNVTTKECAFFTDFFTGGSISVSKLAVDRPTPYADPSTDYEPNPCVMVAPLNVPDNFSGTDTSYSWAYDTPDASTGIDSYGIRGAAIQYTFTANVPGGWKLYKCMAWYELAEEGPQKV